LSQVWPLEQPVITGSWISSNDIGQIKSLSCSRALDNSSSSIFRPQSSLIDLSLEKEGSIWLIVLKAVTLASSPSSSCSVFWIYLIIICGKTSALPERNSKLSSIILSGVRLRSFATFLKRSILLHISSLEDCVLTSSKCLYGSFIIFCLSV